jgi:PAS domain S-box-containing protein
MIQRCWRGFLDVEWWVFFGDSWFILALSLLQPVVMMRKKETAVKFRSARGSRRRVSAVKKKRPRALRAAGSALKKVPGAETPAGDGQDLVHELQVHQVELEMQNEELRRVQLELENSRERFAELYDFAPVAYLTLDAEGVIREANLTAARLLGVSRELLLSRKLTAFIARESQDTFYLQRQLVFTSWTRQTCELQMHSKDGATFFAGLECIVIRDGRPNQRQWLVAFSDITASRQKQEARVQDISSLPDESPHPTMRISAEGLLRYANAASAPFLAAWKCRLNQLVPAEWQDLVRRALERGTLEDREIEFGRATFQYTLAPFKERGYVNLYARDITGRKQAEAALLDSHALLETHVRERTAELEASNAALKKSERELTDFFHSSPLGLLWINPQGRILMANRVQLEMFGRAAREVRGRFVAQFHADREVAADLLQRLARGETVQNHRARLCRKNGGLLHVLIDASGLWEKGRLVHTRWFTRDITQRVELEREIVAIGEQERRRLGQDLHDDLCQQLVGIQFLTSLLGKELAIQSKPLAAQAREIARLTQTAMNQTRELAHGLSPLGLEAEGLMDALRELAERTQKVFHRECKFQCKSPVLVSDPAVSIHLYRIAQEAVNNAIKHGKARRIVIALAAHGNNAILAVEDDGLGIPKQSPKGKGMGLRIMQYRAGVIGGSLLLQRNPNGGITVVCTVLDGLLPPEQRRLNENHTNKTYRLGAKKNLHRR